MSLNLNADVGKILRDLLDKKKSGSGGAVTKTGFAAKIDLYKNTVLYSVLILCAFLSLVFAMYHKANNSVTHDESEFKTSPEIEDAMVKIDADLASQKLILKKNIVKAKEILPKVTATGEEKKLFKLISFLAEKNNLYIKQISKGVVNVVQKTEADKQQVKKFIESPINIEITGGFADYLAFKQDLINEKPVLRVDSEQVQINKIVESKSSISIVAKITDFITDKQDFEKVIQKYDQAENKNNVPKTL
jgi:hypothetical protein